MKPGRQILRLMAVMILAIVAYVAPSAAQAHGGHGHHGHTLVAAPSRAFTPVATAKAPPEWPAARSQAAAWSTVALVPLAGERIASSDEGCCHPGCKTRCCGMMACFATGFLSESVGLSPSRLRAVTLMPRDVPSRAGPGPEALPKPPRTPA